MTESPSNLFSKQTLYVNMSDNDLSDSNSTEPVDDWNYEWNFSFSVILAAILSISAFLAVVGNSMVLTVVIRHRGMRTRTNLFLVNLAVADLLVGAAVIPFAITTLIEGKWIFGSLTGTFCSINGWLNCFCLVASIHTLMYISVHKHYSITKPLGSQFKLRQILGMMAAAWVWAAVSSTITVTGLSSVRYKPGTTQCGPEYPSGLKSYVFHGIIQVTNVFIPVIVLTYCYTRMFREIRAHSKRLQQNSTLEQDIILAQQKKVTITLFIVLIVFVLCVLPFHLYSTYATIKKDKHFSPYLNPVAYAFLYVSSACNPIIYAFRSPSFREGYKEILCQTPHYVISDDAAVDGLQSPLRRRLSSFFGSFRRGSTASSKDIRSSRTSLNSVGSQAGSPNALITSPPGKKRQKSMSGMIRASRRSTKQSSIIRQNGDVIIVKAGKIVSIRRQPGWTGGLQDSSPFIERSVTASAAQKNGAKAAATNGHTTGVSAAQNNNFLEMNKVASQSKASVSSEGSDNVFDGDSLSPVPHSGEMSPVSHLEMISEEKRLLSQTSDFSETLQENKRLLSQTSDFEIISHAEIQHVRKDSLDVVWKKQDTQQFTADGEMDSRHCPHKFASAADAADATLCEHCKNLRGDVTNSSGQQRTDVGIIISIDEDNSILDVMPLTPYTRDRIARSDFLLDSDNNDHDSSLKPLVASKTAKSSQGLHRPPPLQIPPRPQAKGPASKHLLHRMFSVEYLDPPISLTRSRSAQSVQRVTAAASRADRGGGRSGFLNVPSQEPPSGRRWSFGRLMYKKPEHPV